jgi:hypothetical protein
MRKQVQVLSSAIILAIAVAGLAAAAPADPREYDAAKPYYAAAVQGDADAQAKLGALYAKGDGVPQSDTYAFQWFLRAAEQGHASAQLSLSGMFANGQGVARHDVLAYKWANLAEASAADPDVRQRAGEMLDLLARRMPESDLAEARNLVGAPQLASDTRRPAKVESPRVDVAKVEPVKAEPAKVEPTPEATRSEPPRSERSLAGPIKAETDSAGADRPRAEPAVIRPPERRPGRLARMRDELEMAHRTVSILAGVWD